MNNSMRAGVFSIAVLLVASSSVSVFAADAPVAAAPAPALTTSPPPPMDINALQSAIQIDQTPKYTSSSSYDQLVTLQFGQFRPQSLQIANGIYSFNYGNQTSSFMGEAGWAIQLLHTYGSFFFEENLAFSTFSGNAIQNQGSNLQISSGSYSLYLFGFDTRLMYAADWFPVKWVIPFADGGYQYTVYDQSASSGVESVQGGVGNFVAGGGLRLWLNRGSSLSGGSTPLYLSAKFNKIFSNSGSLDLASTSFFGGVSLGL
jgi:hypothetical protein